jgi:hypothetical protein
MTRIFVDVQALYESRAGQRCRVVTVQYPTGDVVHTGSVQIHGPVELRTKGDALWLETESAVTWSKE